MASSEEITDPTDWLPTPLSALAPLESSLRCQVCKDFFTTPMITSCSHTFCSLCIRRYLSQEGKCPACREQDQEIKLRRNWVVEELVTNFQQSRPGLLKVAQEATSKTVLRDDDAERPKKRRKIATDPEPNNLARRSTRSQSKRVTSQASQASLASTQASVPDSDDEGSVYNSSSTPIPPSPSDPDDGLISCPSCSRRMKETQINTHLDRCLNGTATPPRSSPNPPQIKAGTIAYNQTKPLTSNRLPTINYSLLNESKMRAKLKELGIPSTGSKELMRKRHIEWVNLWNANCDSLHQVSKRELLRQLDTWERTLGRQIEKGNQQTNGVMTKDFDREGYMAKQKGEFDDLILQARAKAKAVKAARAEAKAMVEEEDNRQRGVESDQAVNGFAIEEGVSTLAPVQETVGYGQSINGGEEEPIVIEESPIKPLASSQHRIRSPAFL